MDLTQKTGHSRAAFGGLFCTLSCPEVVISVVGVSAGTKQLARAPRHADLAR